MLQWQEASLSMPIARIINRNNLPPACRQIIVIWVLHNIQMATTQEALNTTKTYQEKTIPMIKPGRYRHYKGKDYQVIGIAKHSETEEELVVYRSLYGAHGLWVRPLGMFCEKIESEGELVSRFEWIDAGNLEPSTPAKDPMEK